MKKKKLIIGAVIVVVLIALFASLGGGDDSKKDSKPAATEEKKDDSVATWKTKTGQTCKVYEEAPLDYRAATIKTIEDLVPDADTTNLNSTKGWIYSEYEDGMVEMDTPEVNVNGNDYGCHIMMKFKDDSHTDYSVHYLKVGPDLLRDDGTYDKEDYAEAE